MKKINVVLFGLLLGVAGFTLRAEAVAANDERASVVGAALADLLPGVERNELIASNILDKAEKWQYLEKRFSSGMNRSALRRAFGKISPSIALISLTIVVDFIIFGFLRNKVNAVTGALAKKFKNTDEEIKALSEDFKNGLGLVVIPLIIHGLLHLIGKKIGNNDGRCNQILLNFVKNWKQNKTQTPTVLQPLFEMLSEDYKANGKLTKVDKAVAQKIVESIIATSFLAELATQKQA